MPLVQILVLLIIVGVVLFLINQYIPMAASIKSILHSDGRFHQVDSKCRGGHSGDRLALECIRPAFFQSEDSHRIDSAAA
jgi:hypothetical protein